MGIDLENKGHVRRNGRKFLKSPNPYLGLLHQLYSFLARRTQSNFNKVISKRLIMAKRNKPPLSLSKISYFMKKHEGQTAVIVGTVTNDTRIMYEMPKLKVCALRFSEAARKRIVKAGGECLTFDQLALQNPMGSNCVLLRGPTKAREAERHFGPAPGAKGSHTKPYVRHKVPKLENHR